MSGNKTEKPTNKKIKDAAKKGQSFKSKDLIIACLTLSGITFVVSGPAMTELLSMWPWIIASNFQQDIQAYMLLIFKITLKLFLPILFICVFSSALPALLQTGFLLATKAFKLNFSALNPVNGVKKLFSLRTVKDTIKSILYLISFSVSFYMVWQEKKSLLFSQIYGDSIQLVIIWGELLQTLLFYSMGCILIILILDALAEYFLHIKDLKMEKREVKQENKESDGNPEIKGRRKELHSEILSEQIKSDIKKSQFIIANPTHITIGIYINLDIVAIPFISVIETNQRALAVRKYAEECGTPVIENIALARRIFKKYKRYSFISMEEIDEIIRILVWLEEVENAWKNESLL